MLPHLSPQLWCSQDLAQSGSQSVGIAWRYATPTLVDDEVLNAFAVVAEPDRVAAEIRRRFDGLVDRLSFYTAYELDRSVLEPVVRELRGESS